MNPSFGPNRPRISIVGFGNVLMGDDAFGPLTVEMFRCKYECGPEVEILDLGTPGLDLAPYLYGRDLVVIADTVTADEEPGTVRIYRETDFLDRGAQLQLTTHDPGLQESLAQLRLAGHAPSELIVIGVVPESCAFGKGMSRPVLNASSVAVESIALLLLERAVDCPCRRTPVQPTLWWLSRNKSEFAVPKSDSQSYRAQGDVSPKLQTIGS